MKWTNVYFYLSIYLLQNNSVLRREKKDEKIKYQGSSALMIAPTRLFCIYEKPPYLPLPVYTDKGYWIGCWALVNPSLLQINSNQTSCDKLRPRRLPNLGIPRRRFCVLCWWWALSSLPSPFSSSKKKKKMDTCQTLEILRKLAHQISHHNLPTHL